MVFETKNVNTSIHQPSKKHQKKTFENWRVMQDDDMCVLFNLENMGGGILHFKLCLVSTHVSDLKRLRNDFKAVFHQIFTDNARSAAGVSNT